MRSNFDDVGDFHARFGLDNVTWKGAGIRDVDPALMEFRIKFLEEELTEFKEAAATGDHSKMFDALLDLAYVTFGTAHLLGYPWQAGWDAVQAANMRKMRTPGADDSKRGSAYDVIKPPDWEPPDLDEVLFHTMPKYCPQCRRQLEGETLREVIVDRGGVQYVTVHCPCGRQLLTRPA